MTDKRSRSSQAPENASPEPETHQDHDEKQAATPDNSAGPDAPDADETDEADDTEEEIEFQPDLAAFQALIGVAFNDLAILREALTHRSYANERDSIPDYERLEFLGDAVLDFIVADLLFRLEPPIPEGEMTQLRAALVRNESLAMLAADFHLGDFFYMGKGEVNSGGRTRYNNLGRGFEALLGAIYIDQGLDALRAFLQPRLDRLLAYVLDNQLHIDARSELQERSQAEIHITPYYRVIDTAGPDHDKQYLVEVIIGDTVVGQGTGTNKRAAAQSAARDALQQQAVTGWPAEATFPEDDTPPEAKKAPQRQPRRGSRRSSSSRSSRGRSGQRPRPRRQGKPKKPKKNDDDA